MPEGVRGYLRGLGFRLPLEDMKPHILAWERWMRAEGEFYDYRDTDGFGRVYEVHRRSIMPAMRVCREWGSLLLDEKTQVACEDQEASSPALPTPTRFRTGHAGRWPERSPTTSSTATTRAAFVC